VEETPHLQSVAGEPYVLIATNPTDSDSFLIQEALRRKGANAELIHLSDFPTHATASLHIDPSDERSDRWYFLQELNVVRPDTIWWRRPGRPVIPTDVHPADREFVRQEANRFLSGLWHYPPQGTVCVNSPVRAIAADHKPYQLRVARDVGFTIPPTLFSNDPAEIRSAIRSWGGRCIYKSLGSVNNFWFDSRRGRMFALFTTMVDESSLPDDATLSLTPGIYQPRLPKAFDLRLTMFGATAFATRIHSQEQERSKVDWRNGQRALCYEAIQPPPGLVRLCRSMLRRLGLLMGCFDFVITPEREPIFLEVNEGGQFLWLENVSGAPILDAFSGFLLEPRQDFRWKPAGECLRIEHVKSAAAERMAQATEGHLAPEQPAQLKGIFSPGAAKEKFH
jgi:glutathione synthase/RimK-type ligase-like ATP-grasp enzyme